MSDAIFLLINTVKIDISSEVKYNIFNHWIIRLSSFVMLSASPLDSYFEIISGLDYDILRVLVPQIIHVGGVDFDNRITSFKTGSFRRRTAVNLQSKQTDSYLCREKSR